MAFVLAEEANPINKDSRSRKKKWEDFGGSYDKERLGRRLIDTRSYFYGEVDSRLSVGISFLECAILISRSSVSSMDFSSNTEIFRIVSLPYSRA